MSKENRTCEMRYKRPALMSLGYEAILAELEAINEACSDIHWFVDQDDETLLNALEGDEEQAWEFKVAFADMEAKADRLYNALIYNLGRWEEGERVFDDCIVALIGNRYRILGYDMEEEDYYGLTSYEQDLAYTEAGKRIMRRTKADMLSTIGQCLGALIAFLDLRQSYDYLKATFDILRDDNTSLLRTIKEIDEAYEAADNVGWYEWKDEVKRFNHLLAALPEMAWVG